MARPTRRRSWADGGGQSVDVGNWERLVDHLERFSQGGTFTADDERIVCEFPNAKVVVTRDGTVETGMPLHTFERENVERLLLDHDRGELTVRTTTDGDRLDYTFHRP